MKWDNVMCQRPEIMQELICQYPTSQTCKFRTSFCGCVFDTSQKKMFYIMHSESLYAYHCCNCCSAPRTKACVCFSNLFFCSSCGESHTCAVRNEATVVCWGSNVYNQSSVPGTISYLDPVTNTKKSTPFKFSSCFPGFTTKLSEILG